MKTTMHDPNKKLPVEFWAQKKNGRTRIMVHVEGEEPLELLSWPDGLDKMGLTSDPAAFEMLNDWKVEI